jgi:hypothetical protein
VDGDGDDCIVPPDKQWAAAVPFLCRDPMLKDRPLNLVVFLLIILLKERLQSCFLVAGIYAVAGKAYILHLLDVIEAQLDVGWPGYPSVEFEEGVVVLQHFLRLAGLVLFVVADVDDLAGVDIGELSRDSRIKDHVLKPLPITAGVDVVCHGEHQVAGNQEASANQHSSVASPAIDHPHTVIGELFGLLLSEAHKLAPEECLVLEGHLNILHQYYYDINKMDLLFIVMS